MVKARLRAVTITALCVSAVVAGCEQKSEHAGEQPTPGQTEHSALEHAKSFYVREGSPYRVIVFVHGIFGNPTGTWSYSPTISWPQMLIKDSAFDHSDIYVAGYDTPYTGNQMTIDEIVENLKNRFDSDGVFSKHREVVFVAHSLGGLVVQRYLLAHHEFAQQVPFIYFFSTPESGAQIAKLGSLFSADPLLKEMFPEDQNDYLLNMENEWRGAKFSILRYCAYEKKSLRGVLVVDRLSGTRGCEQGAIPMSEDHSSIVKPPDSSAASYLALRNAIVANPIKPAPIPVHTATITKKWSSYQQVGCNQTNSQTLTASVPVDSSLKESITAVAPGIESADKIQGLTGPTVLSWSGNTAQIKYGFNGLDKDTFGNCPGGGHATITATFTVQQTVPD